MAPHDDDEPPAKTRKLTNGISASASHHNMHSTETSFFEMQLQSMIKEVTLSEDKGCRIDEYVTKVIEDICNTKPCKKQLKLNVLSDVFDGSESMDFVPPTSVDVIGSYTVRTNIKPKTAVDLSIEIPSECFTQKLVVSRYHLRNHHYYRIRALYLYHIAVHLSKCRTVSDVSFSYHNGNHLLPIVVLTPAGEEAKLKNVSVHLHTTVPEPDSLINKCRLSINNLKSFTSKDTQMSTPYYNTTLLYDLLQQQHTTLIIEALKDNRAVRNTLVLLKVWLRQRQLDQGASHFSSFLMTMFVVYLLKIKKIKNSMPTSHIFKLCLEELTQVNFQAGINLADIVGVCQKNRQKTSEFSQHFDLVFVDSSGTMNLCADLSPHTLSLVKHEAAQSLHLLKASPTESFDSLFIKRHTFIHKYDQVIRLSNLTQLKSSCVQHISSIGMTHTADRGHNYVKLCTPELVKLLLKALDKRVRYIHIVHTGTQQWSILDRAPSSQSGHLDIGLLVDASCAYSAQVLGPSPDQPEVKDFVNFWGKERCELRRFKDSSVLETVNFDAVKLVERRTVNAQIVKHIFNKWLSFKTEDIHLINTIADAPLQALPCHPCGEAYTGTGEEATEAVQRVYEELCRKIKATVKLPLNITSFQGVHPVFRHAEVFPPLPARCSVHLIQKGHKYLPPDTDKPSPVFTPTITVQCMLQGSGHWPDELEAFLAAKKEFIFTLMSQIRHKLQLPARSRGDHVDVLWRGYVFRLELCCLREISVRKTVKDEMGMEILQETEITKTVEHNLTAHPAVVSALAGLQNISTSYSGSVRLAKRWVAAHMLSDHIPSEAVELIVAHIYTHPHPYEVPSSILGGFMRFLEFLLKHNWNIQPLIVDINKDFSDIERTDLMKSFSSDRSSYPLMCIMTPYDKYKSFYTRHIPNATMLNRLILLATESVTRINDLLTDSDQLAKVDLMPILKTPLASYNVVIHLRTTQLPRHYQSLGCQRDLIINRYYGDAGSDKNEELPSNVLPVTDYDPAQYYLRDLRACYDEVAAFFYDEYGGKVIGVLWKPEAFKAHPLSTAHAAYRSPVTDDASEDLVVKPNRPAIIEDFKLLGQGLVMSVTVNK